DESTDEIAAEGEYSEEVDMEDEYAAVDSVSAPESESVSSLEVAITEKQSSVSRTESQMRSLEFPSGSQAKNESVASGGRAMRKQQTITPPQSAPVPASALQSSSRELSVATKATPTQPRPSAGSSAGAPAAEIGAMGGMGFDGGAGGYGMEMDFAPAPGAPAEQDGDMMGIMGGMEGDFGVGGGMEKGDMMGMETEDAFAGGMGGMGMGMGGGGMGGGGGGGVAEAKVARRGRDVGFVELEPRPESPQSINGVPILSQTGRRRGGSNLDRYAPIVDNDFESVVRAPLSTFSIDVDTASYTKIRMDLMQFNRLPNPDAVRIEEMINYFSYDYAPPRDDHPFAAAMEVASCPWNPDHRLARIGIQGKVIDQERPASNLVFLLDVSGSMNQPNKLPLVVDGMRMLVNQLGENDSVAIVVYAGAAGLVLDATSGDRKKKIYDSLNQLRAGGSTNGGQGIQLAYDVARDHFIPGGTNRVILCSDGDFNVGVTGTDELVRLAERNAKDNIFLSVLGFGTGNHNDAMMEQISNKANGNYGFVDTEDEARRVFVDQMQSTLVTIAKDVKIQIEFNPAEVSSYRLIGYANRMLAAEDFKNDSVDAGEIGAGHRVTALYEIVPAKKQAVSDDAEADSEDSPSESTLATPDVEPLRYQKPVQLSEEATGGELLTLKLRYKQPEADKSQLITIPVRDDEQALQDAGRDFQFAAAVAGFGMLLRNSEHKGNATFNMMEDLAKQGASEDTSGYRTEFLEMVRRAKSLAR
ncbi:MAG: VWA domain-containing protein, partial [Planctomycetota bacterium]